MNDFGTHVHLDMWFMEKDKKILFSDNCQPFIACLLEACEKAGAVVLSKHFHEFGEECGFTGVILLSESHASVHTWPESNFAAIDFYMCGPTAFPKEAANHMIYIFNPNKVVLESFKRGSQ